MSSNPGPGSDSFLAPVLVHTSAANQMSDAALRLTFLSMRPGRKSAESRMSILLVAISTCTQPNTVKRLGLPDVLEEGSTGMAACLQWYACQDTQLCGDLDTAKPY
eukprot:1160911-Pelagomonas_calceolata.AAC.20